jgi:magnesium-transporting ATPase (P-type)
MAFSEAQAKQLKGLSRNEVLEKLKSEGYNELPSSKQRNILAIAFEVVKEPMVLLPVHIVLLGLVIFVPFLQDIFHFAPMHAIDFCLVFVAGIVSITWFELMKIFMRKEHVDLMENKA